MILRVSRVARSAVRAGGSGEDALEDFDEFDHADFQAGFLRQFAHDALLDGFTHFEEATGDGPFSLERGPAAADQQGALVVNYHAAHADHGLIRVFSSGGHYRFWALPSRGASGYIILQQHARPNSRELSALPENGGDPRGIPKEVFAVVRCPECATEIDVDEDEVEEGEILACPECETEMEVVQIHPVKVNAISDDDDEEEEEESEDGDDLLEDEDGEDEEEEV